MMSLPKLSNKCKKEKYKRKKESILINWNNFKIKFEPF